MLYTDMFCLIYKHSPLGTCAYIYIYIYIYICVLGKALLPVLCINTLIAFQGTDVTGFEIT